ncbi:uncharacterized protein LOC135713450 [Ochlerotatus camptorhynchus]|uniref:uncharacterized protein LOC135713450 n=1 Tax=Ochlerotatus camptorhynchus TaxID=644619 RepID=UPI0031DF78C1
MPTTTRAAAKANAEIPQCICELCKNPNHVEEMVACDQCRRWYHCTCAEVAEGFTGKWTCKDCISTWTVSGASTSGKSSNISQSTRIQFQLMRLEEERKSQEKLIQEQQQQDRARLAAKAALDKKYLDEKYALLIAEAEEEEAGSRRSRRSRMSRNSQVQEWIQELDGAVGGNLIPVNINDIFPPISIGTESGVPCGGMLTKYTGAVSKNPLKHLNDRYRNPSRQPTTEWIADNVGTENTGSLPGMKDPITASTPIRSVGIVRQPTVQSSLPTQTVVIQPVFTQPVYTQSVLAQPLQSQPTLSKLVPRTRPPTFLFPEPPSRPPAAQVPVSPPPVSEPSLLRSSVQQLYVSNLESQPNSSQQRPPTFRSLISPPSCTPPLVHSPQEPTIHRSTEQRSSAHLPPTSQASFQQSHTLAHPSGSAMCDQFDERSQPPSVLRTVVSNTSPLPHPTVSEPFLPGTSVPQAITSNPSPHQRAVSYVDFQQQLAARQVVPRDLPIFNGNPEEWPLFISSYRNSTAMCGYSDAENLMRLQRCLKGSALEAVRSNLLIPASVPQVLSTLETLFGSPDRLLQSMLNKVRSVPAPKLERLETLVNFGITGLGGEPA